MKKVLVTGASGFIGSRLIKRLKQDGFTVVGGVRTPVEGPWDQELVIDFASDSVPESPLGDVEGIFHLAGKAHVLSESKQEEDKYFHVNAEGTRKLLKAARRAGVKKFVYFSSVKAAGDADGIMNEVNACEPDTPYGQSKLEAEKYVLEGGYVSFTAVIRPSMVYGETAKGNLPKMIQAIQRGRFPPLPRFINKRSMVHVDDLVEAALLAYQKPEASGQTYIVTDGKTYSTRQMYEWICECLDKPVPSWDVPMSVLNLLAKVGDAIGRVRGRRFLFDSDVLDKLVGSTNYSSEKIERELGFQPKRNLHSALPEIVAFLRCR